MILIALSIVIIELLLIAYCEFKRYALNRDSWIFYDNIFDELRTTNKKSDEVLAFLKLTFNRNFAQKIEDVMRIKSGAPQTIRRVCADGEEHEVPIDAGF